MFSPSMGGLQFDWTCSVVITTGKSNFQLRSDLKSKESTLQVVYDVLKLTLFYKAFLVTTNVPKIYMQEFWAIATVHHHSICFKMNNKKRIVNLEYFREMLQISPRIPNQQFDELPFEEVILAFLREIGHSEEIKMITEDFVYQVEHKDAKKSNEMYNPRFTKVIVNFFMTGTGNSFTYDKILESYDEVPNPPPQCHFNIYLCQICKSNSHCGYEYSQRVPLVYEPESCYIQNFNDNDYSHDLPGVNPLIDHHCCYECGNSLNDFFCYQCTYEFCGNGAHVGYNCPAQVPSFQTLPSFPQQYPCCEDCGVTHEPYQCQPKNHDYYHEQNSCYNSNSFGFDHGQPPQYTINHPIFNVHNDILTSQTTIVEQMTQLTSVCEMFCQFVQKKREEKRIEEEQAAKAQNWKLPICYDDDDDEERSNSLQDNIISGLPPCSAITPDEPVDSLSMGDEHLNTIPATESDEFIKSCVENLVPNPSESEGKNGCDLPACFTTFSNVLFDADYESDSKSNLIESMLNHDSSIIPSSTKIDSLLDEFASKLTLLKSILPGIDETDCHPENEIRFSERLLYDNSSPRPPEKFVSKNSDAEIESFSPSPIPNEDSDSYMEEIDLSFNPDDPMSPSIEEDDDDSERDILIHEELLDNYSLSLPVNESFYFDIPSFSRPPAKPPDRNTGILNIKMMGDISDQKLSTKCPMMIHGKNIPILDDALFHFYLLDQFNLLHLAGSQPMLKSSYKAEDGVIISILPLVGGMADVVVEIKGTDFKDFGCRRKKQSSSDTTVPPPTKGKRLKTLAKVDKLAKEKKPAKSSTTKGLTVLYEVALTEAEQVKLAIKKCLTKTHISHASGSGTDEGTGIIPGVPDVPNYKSDDEEISWKSSEEDGNNNDAEEKISKHDDDFSTHDKEAKDEESFDPIVRTPSHDDKTDDEDNDDDSDGMNVEGDEGANEEDDADELYRDVNINLEGRDISSVSSRFISSMLNPSPDTGFDSIFDSTPRIDVSVTTAAEPPLLSATTLPPPTISIIPHVQQTPAHSPTNVPSSSLQDLPNFGSLFGFDHRVKTLETNFPEFMKQTNLLKPRDLSELKLQKILIEKIKSNKSIHRSDEQKNLYKALVDAYECDKLILDTYEDTVTLKRRRDDDDKDEEPSTGSNRGSKRRREGKEPESTSAPKEKTSKKSGKSTEGSKSRHKIASESALAEELMHTTQDLEEPAPQEFETAFVMNWLKVDTLTPELLAGPTYELMKGSCKSLQYPHDLLKPLPLIPNSRGRCVIPFGHFINNDHKYLRGDASSQKFTNSVTKTKVAVYGHIKWIEGLVPRTMWSQVLVSYDKHALWGISQWGRKRQHFYGFMVNRESSRDVYSKRRIIAVTELQIVKWHNYKHLDWITIRRDDDTLYKFKEDDFKRLRIQDIEDMLVLLVQGKLTNLTVDERFAFNVSLRISDFKHKEAWTAYSNRRGFIYQNKDKQNRLMRIDELHKFSDGILNDVRTTLDDRLKGIRMQYLPQTIWRRSDKDRAATMIQAIDKQLKTRRIMQSLDKFDCDGIPKRPTMYFNLWIYKAVRHRYSNPMIQSEPEGSTQGYPLVSVEVLRILKDGGEEIIHEFSSLDPDSLNQAIMRYPEIQAT
uniref:Reverse transcriptase domain-containing protein n=1 Tax=Tanacetum cinerariifolium TaxID=118510 RepID=A0A6L2N5Z8_TANCI|nr:hypothetical protein [Tanacetum cinerariifolium]